MKFFLLLLTLAAGKCLAKHPIHRNARMHLPLQPDVNTRVVGGEDAEITSFPYQISLQVNGRHYCGGSILDKDYIVTAAHCTDDYRENVSNFSVRTGSSFISTGGTVVSLSEIIQHESYDSNTYDYDVAILKLNSSLTFSDSIKPIPLATEMPSDGTNGNLTGWGKSSEFGGAMNQLQVVEIPITPKWICRLRVPLTERQFCVGTLLGNKLSCEGDSGGPFAVNGKLVGIVSLGPQLCGLPGTPGIYESVPVLAEWIRSKTTAAPVISSTSTTKIAESAKTTTSTKTL